MFRRPWFPRVFKAIINSKILIGFPLCSSVFLVMSVRLKGPFKSTCITTKCYLKIFEVFEVLSGALNLNIYSDPQWIFSNQPLISPKGAVLGNKIWRKSTRKTIKGTSVSWTFEGRAGRSRENQDHRRTAHCTQSNLTIWTPYSLHMGTRLRSFRKPERKAAWPH